MEGVVDAVIHVQFVPDTRCRQGFLVRGYSRVDPPVEAGVMKEYCGFDPRHIGRGRLASVEGNRRP